jgi:hypothetical protein
LALVNGEYFFRYTSDLISFFLEEKGGDTVFSKKKSVNLLLRFFQLQKQFTPKRRNQDQFFFRILELSRFL